VTAVESSTKVVLAAPVEDRKTDSPTGPLVAPAVHHRIHSHHLHRLFDVGRFPEPLLLCRCQHGSRPHQPVLFALHRRSLRARSEGGVHPQLVPALAALLILIFPLGFRFTCYYYRRSYYRAFWWSPPACAVSDAHGKYSGETRFPLVMQNLHRYFFYAGLVFNVLLTIDAVEPSANRESGGASASAPTVVLCVNAVLLWM